MAGIKIRKLTKYYVLNGERIEALKDVDLDIENGSLTTVVGKSGCGKTTLLRILCGLEEKSGGDVSYIGHGDFLKNPPKVSIVFQEPRLMPWLTVRENMEFSFRSKSEREMNCDKVDRCMKMLGLSQFRGAYPRQISGGMAQRVALGRTLCNEPDIILMDEPLGALDAYNRRMLQNELIDIFESFGTTIVFVTHDIEEAVYLGQKIVVIEKGGIIDEINVCGSYPRDMDSGKYLGIRRGVLKSFSESHRGLALA